jgi:hypothetical protein
VIPKYRPNQRVRWPWPAKPARAAAVPGRGRGGAGSASDSTPGPALALLGRFLVLCGHDDASTIVAMLDAAFTGLRPERVDGFWPDTREHGLDRADFWGQGVFWQRDTDGHHQLRRDDAGNYPAQPVQPPGMGAPR